MPAISINKFLARGSFEMLEWFQRMLDVCASRASAKHNDFQITFVSNILTGCRLAEAPAPAATSKDERPTGMPGLLE